MTCSPSASVSRYQIDTIKADNKMASTDVKVGQKLKIGDRSANQLTGSGQPG
jgi:hypothetical protein